jgi:hypothetical protein
VGPFAKGPIFIMRNKYNFKILLLVFIAMTPIALILLPADFFDGGKSICISKLFTDKECYACGLTRGIMHLIHLDFETAFAYNMLSFIVLPLLGVIWVQWFLKEYKLLKKLKLKMNQHNGL